jgi:phosphoesterase RecJ-like protein
MRPIQDAFSLLKTPQKIFIVTHHKPDGDAIGSMLGLSHFLKKLGHEVAAIEPSEMPEFLLWMPGVDDVFNYEEKPEKCEEAFKQADLIFCLDFNDPSRTKYFTQHLEQTTQPKIIIDHHLFPKECWNYGMINSEKSSTSEMVYDFINLMGMNELIDTNIAICLYTGLMTDTGSFRFSCTTEETHLMVADLKRKGLEHSFIHEQVNDSWSLKRMQFLGYVLLEKMEIFSQDHAGLIALSKQDLKTFGININETEGLVNQPLSIKGVQFATLITERADEVRLSFRSKGALDVNAFARKYFSGGGHMNASGGKSNLSFSETVTYFKQILNEIRPQ